MMSSEVQGPPAYVADTHALWWYLGSSDRLSPAADAVFRLIETGNALLVIPAIVIAEMYFLSVKLDQPISPAELLETLDSVDGLVISPLDGEQLVRLAVTAEIYCLPDVAAETLVRLGDQIGHDKVEPSLDALVRNSPFPDIGSYDMLIRRFEQSVRSFAPTKRPARSWRSRVTRLFYRRH